MAISPYNPEFDAGASDRAHERGASAADDAWTDGSHFWEPGRKLPEFNPTQAQCDAVARAIAEIVGVQTPARRRAA